MEEYKLKYFVWYDNKNRVCDTNDKLVLIYEGYDEDTAVDLESEYHGSIKEITREYK